MHCNKFFTIKMQKPDYLKRKRERMEMGREKGFVRSGAL